MPQEVRSRQNVTGARYQGEGVEDLKKIRVERQRWLATLCSSLARLRREREAPVFWWNAPGACDTIAPFGPLLLQPAMGHRRGDEELLDDGESGVVVSVGDDGTLQIKTQRSGVAPRPRTR